MFSFCAHSVVRGLDVLGHRTDRVPALGDLLADVLEVDELAGDRGDDGHRGAVDREVGVLGRRLEWREPRRHRRPQQQRVGLQHELRLDDLGRQRRCDLLRAEEDRNGADGDLRRGREDAPGERGRALDVGLVDRRGGRADGELTRVALALAERSHDDVLGLFPPDADAGLRLHDDDLGALEAEPTVDEPLAGLCDPGVEHRVEATGVHVDHERHLVGAEPAHEHAADLVERVAAAAGEARLADARIGVDLQPERGGIDREVRRARAP